MTSLLARICDDKRRHIDRKKNEQSIAQFEDRISGLGKPRGFQQALKLTFDKNQIALIAEIKKASPSAGLIRPSFSPKELARSYENAGASCLSVLTDEPYFKGNNEHLLEVGQHSTLPILRKDFIIDPWQIYEARAISSDCILLIMAVLTDQEVLSLSTCASQLGLDILFEVHTEDELKRALRFDRGLIGINNRDLNTLKIDLSVTAKLSPHIPKDRFLVSESGIRTARDIQFLLSVGAHAFLVGESLLNHNDVELATRRLMGQES